MGKNGWSMRNLSIVQTYSDTVWLDISTFPKNKTKNVRSRFKVTPNPTYKNNLFTMDHLETY